MLQKSTQLVIANPGGGAGGFYLPKSRTGGYFTKNSGGFGGFIFPYSCKIFVFFLFEEYGYNIKVILLSEKIKEKKYGYWERQRYVPPPLLQQYYCCRTRYTIVVVSYCHKKCCKFNVYGYTVHYICIIYLVIIHPVVGLAAGISRPGNSREIAIFFPGISRNSSQISRFFPGYVLQISSRFFTQFQTFFANFLTQHVTTVPR